MGPERANLVALTAKIVSDYVLNNSTVASDVPVLIQATYAALADIQAGGAHIQQPLSSSVTSLQIKRSITHDALISFEDGKPYKALKRHLTTRGLTPEQYREKWGLPSDYPMTSQGYSQERSNLAKMSGLGHIIKYSGKGKRGVKHD
jgi:predicted transcriptional regulator